MVEQTVNREKQPVLEISGLKKYFPTKDSENNKQYVKAVNDVSIDLYEGETFGLVGESGCGKSTLGRAVLRLIEPTSGSAIYKGEDLFSINKKSFKKKRKELQMIFQDPYSSLNPKKRIGDILEEPLHIHKIGHKKERTNIAMEILYKVGLESSHYYRYPHEFSGGQKQRIGLARSLIVDPSVVICDEPVSALDVSIQSQVINLLRELQSEMDLSYLFISHDMSVVRYISDRVGVMYLGGMVEVAETDNLFENPLHPYTQALLSAIPIPKINQKRERIKLKGEVPSPLNLPSGCVFHTRCPFAMDICKQQVPVPKEVYPDHTVSCHLYNDK